MWEFIKIKKTIFFIIFFIFLASCNHQLSYDQKIDCNQNWALCSIQKEYADPNSLTDTPLKIAIIDSGIDEEKARVKVSKRFNEKNNQIDSYGHGTAVASIIAAQSNQKDHVEGVIKNIEIYDVNVLDANGNGDIDDITEGIEWCVNQNVDIINMSFGIQKDDARLRAAVEKAINHDIIIVAAAGNTLGLYTEYPAKYESVLSISAIDKNMKIYKYAAKGKIDFVAPGVDIVAIKTGKLSHQKELSGTSFATAYATGIIASLLNNKEIHKETVHKDLLEYSKDLGESGCDDLYGCGLLTLNHRK